MNFEAEMSRFEAEIRQQHNSGSMGQYMRAPQGQNYFMPPQMQRQPHLAAAPVLTAPPRSSSTISAAATTTKPAADEDDDILATLQKYEAEVKKPKTSMTPSTVQRHQQALNPLLNKVTTTTSTNPSTSGLTGNLKLSIKRSKILPIHYHNIERHGISMRQFTF